MTARFQRLTLHDNMQVFGYWPNYSANISRQLITPVVASADIEPILATQKKMFPNILEGVCTYIYESDVYEYDVYEVDCI